MMGDVKSSSPMGNRERDRELLIPVATAADDPASRASSSSASPAHHHHHPHPTSHSGREFHVSSPFTSVVIGSNLASAMWMLMDLSLGLASCVILFPIAITFYITWWFIRFVDGFFSPIYAQLGINIFGLGFVTSILFIFLVGVFMSSWLGTSVLNLGEWFIKRMPFVRHIYNASKQISSAVSPDQNKQAFKEVVIIRHPRVGEYAFGFITSTVILQSYSGEDELFCVYVPTNHLYIGDIFLVNSNDVIRPNLSVREGIAIALCFRDEYNLLALHMIKRKKQGALGARNSNIQSPMLASQLRAIGNGPAEMRTTHTRVAHKLANQCACDTK
ncbi:hypothetical protein MUK42_33925 [Musa troglodytarum]|uniref:Uncharacterized protein n=1 Tax=Musa troglodytarum TaxID=320322 RepID=A0A9E7I2J0_9LILI|nr:hypothetical protein MUK42_33925 [Musa troglodytarum]